MAQNTVRTGMRDRKDPAVPYGVYDVFANEGFANVGTNHDTGEFAVASIRTWWTRMGQGPLPGGHPPVYRERWRRQHLFHR